MAQYTFFLNKFTHTTYIFSNQYLTFIGNSLVCLSYIDCVVNQLGSLGSLRQL